MLHADRGGHVEVVRVLEPSRVTAGTACLPQCDGHEVLEKLVHVEQEPVDPQSADGMLDGRVSQDSPDQVQSLVVPRVEA